MLRICDRDLRSNEARRNHEVISRMGKETAPVPSQESVRVSEITLNLKTILSIRHGVILPYGNVTANFFEIMTEGL